MNQSRKEKLSSIRNKLIHSRPHRIGFIAIPLFLIFFTVKQFCTEEQFVMVMVLFLIAMVAFLMYNFRITDKANITIKEQHKLLEQKQQEILSSISYALRIQNAILPSQKTIKQNLEQYFILYKPKDIVAGDFYWIEKVNDGILFAACDCTGHGVPGAMVSVVCNNALNRAVREFALTQPAAILDKTAEIITENFSKSENEIQDGMDISICLLNVQSKTLQWSGANNPLWLIRNGELTETKANKQSIGKSDHIQPFANHKFQMEAGDTLYIFSDGFADQFGGKPEKKLTRKRFKELLLSIQQLPMTEQGAALENFITSYRKETEQTDDILVMGIKI